MTHHDQHELQILSLQIEKRSHMKILDKIGPRIEPCGTRNRYKILIDETFFSNCQNTRVT